MNINILNAYLRGEYWSSVCDESPYKHADGSECNAASPDTCPLNKKAEKSDKIDLNNEYWKNVDYRKLDEQSKFLDQEEKARMKREDAALTEAQTIIGLIDEGATLSPNQVVEVLGCGERDWDIDDKMYALKYINDIGDEKMEDLYYLVEEKPSNKEFLMRKSPGFKAFVQDFEKKYA